MATTVALGVSEMFSWLKTKRKQEHLKLLFQNKAASAFIGEAFDRRGFTADAERMQKIYDQTESISQSSLPGTNDIRALLEINRELRKLFVIPEAMGAVESLRQRLGQPHQRPSFDAQFQPLEGWLSYYANRGVE